jgi:hypothetical protein
METTAPKSTLFGYAAEFETPEALITAARLAREAGYTQMDAYSPMPVEGLSEADWLSQQADAVHDVDGRHHRRNDCHGRTVVCQLAIVSAERRWTALFQLADVYRADF